MNTNPFPQLDEPDARRVHDQQELAEVTDWLKRLESGNYQFTPEQRTEIEKLFDPADWEELQRGYDIQLWFPMVRRVLVRRDKTLRQDLRYPAANGTTEVKAATN